MGLLDIPDTFGGERYMLVPSLRMKKNESTTYGKLKIHIVPPWHEDTKVCIKYPSHIIKITTITEGLDGVYWLVNNGLFYNEQ